MRFDLSDVLILVGFSVFLTGLVATTNWGIAAIVGGGLTIVGGILHAASDRPGADEIPTREAGR